MRFLAIQNCAVEGFGLFGTLLPRFDVELDRFPAFDGGLLPPYEDYDAILIGGTPVAAYAIENHPFLMAEERYLRSALASEKPCYGICFGAQLMAKVLGAGVRQAERKEIGVYEVELTPAGVKDPLLAGLPRSFRVFQWHGDTFDIPPGAEHLIRGAGCANQMFRRGNAAGVQFHLEITSGEVESWMSAYNDELQAFGADPQELLVEVRRREHELALLARTAITNFVQWVSATSASRRAPGAL